LDAIRATYGGEVKFQYFLNKSHLEICTIKKIIIAHVITQIIIKFLFPVKRKPIEVIKITIQLIVFNLKLLLLLVLLSIAAMLFLSAV
jgi:hypothetical protein